MMDIVASLVYLKHKYHNIQGESFTINSDLEGQQRIYQALQKDQGEGVSIKINITSLTGHISMMGIHPLISGKVDKGRAWQISGG